MANEIKDPSPVCPICGRYLTVLGCTAERCASPPGEEIVTDVFPALLGSESWRDGRIVVTSGYNAIPDAPLTPEEQADEKASPRPWRWASEGQDDQVLLDADGERILGVDKMNWNRADAALIASAPTLRDQRDRAVALLRDLLPEHPLDEPQSPETWERVRAFLAEVDVS